MAIGGGMAAIQGGDAGDIILGAAIGGATAGMAAPAGTATSWSTTFLSTSAQQAAGAGFLAPAVSAGMSGGMMGGTMAGMLSPQTPDYSQFGQGAQPYEYSSQHATVTGSGARQAAAVLASEIKQAKSLRQRQAGVADYGLGMDVAGTGLQIA